MVFRLNEDFFDDIDQDEIINTDDIDNELDEEKHKITICVDRLRDKEYNKTYINNNRIREIDKYIRAFCYHTVMGLTVLDYYNDMSKRINYSIT